MPFISIILEDETIIVNDECIDSDVLSLFSLNVGKRAKII